MGRLIIFEATGTAGSGLASGLGQLIEGGEHGACQDATMAQPTGADQSGAAVLYRPQRVSMGANLSSSS